MILLTGATGFVGSALANRFHSDAAGVHVVATIHFEGCARTRSYLWSIQA